jgi:very-short-patch-repair endonuclease
MNARVKGSEWEGFGAAPAAKKPKPRDDSAEREFDFQCRAYKLPPAIRKHRMPSASGLLTPKTQVLATWEFDFAFLEQRLLVEIDGGIFMPGGGAHSHPVDITRNMTKRNDAALGGFWLLAFTPREVRNGHAIAFTQKKLATLGWRPAP